MDLSGLIFVVLAVAWAGYLIPRALRHHDEVAANRPVDSFSDTMRVLERTPATMKALLTPPAVKPTGKSAVKPTGKPTGKSSTKTPKKATSSARPVSRTVARGAARRRRRVLGLLLFVTAATAGVAAFHYVSWFSVAVPGLLVIGWLVLCRLMVRKAPVTHRRPVQTVAEEDPTVVEEGPLGARLETPPADPVAALEDDGSLWDPLPLTLPTYVTKPAARRTVRTIDLTQTGVTSSGHRAEDTQIARTAEVDAKAAGAAGESQQRKAAGA